MKSTEILDLERKIDKAVDLFKSQENGSDKYLSMQKQIFDTQIELLKDNLKEKERQIELRDRELEKLDKLLDNRDEKISELEKQTGFNQWIQIGKEFLAMKSGKAQPLKDFSSSNRSDIPDPILTSLGVVDWDQVDQIAVDEILNYLNIFIVKLPLKEKTS